MKSISQSSIKLFLILSFGCTGLLDSSALVSAQLYTLKPSDPSSDRFVLPTPEFPKLSQYVAFTQPPPDGPPPGGRLRGGARRGTDLCPPLLQPDLAALVPSTEEADSVTNVWGRTTQERPSFWFYIPYTQKSGYPAEFVLQDQDPDSTLIYKTAIALPTQPGIIRVSLPASVSPLALDKQYRWFLKVSCNQQKESPPPPVYVEGVIQRVNLSQATVQELKTAKPLERFNIYVQKQIWYEALETLAELRQQNPKDPTIQAQWQKLLANIRLDDIAAEPIVLEKP